jgi:hypothetical protein
VLDTQEVAVDGRREVLLRLLPRGSALARLVEADALAQELRVLVRVLGLEAHEDGATWAEVGDALGVSAATAHERFSSANGRASRRLHRLR